MNEYCNGCSNAMLPFIEGDFMPMTPVIACRVHNVNIVSKSYKKTPEGKVVWLFKRPEVCIDSQSYSQIKRGEMPAPSDI